MDKSTKLSSLNIENSQDHNQTAEGNCSSNERDEDSACSAEHFPDKINPSTDNIKRTSLESLRASDDITHDNGTEEQVDFHAGEAVAPDGGWGWVIVLGATVSHFFLVGFARCLGVIYQILRERYDSSSAETAWIASAFNTSRTLTAPLCSLLCERFGCRAVAMVGGVLFSAGLIVSAFATSLLYLFFSFSLLAGIGGVMVFTPAYIMIGRYFDKNKGKAMGLATIGSGLGNVVLAPVINLLLHSYGFYGAMLILGGLVLNTVVAGALYRPLKVESHANSVSKNTEREITSDKDIGKSRDSTSLADGSKQKLCSCCRDGGCLSAQICSNRSFIIYCFLMAGMQYSIMGMLVFLPGYAEELQISDADSALLLSIYGFVDMVSRFGYAFLFDIKSIRNSRRYPYALLGILFGASTMVIGLMKTHVAIAIAVAVNALFEAGFHSQRATILSELVDKSQMSMAVGLMIAFQGVGNLTGPPIGGVLRDQSGSHNVCFFFGGGVFTLIGIVFALALAKQYGACRRCQSRPLHGPDSCQATLNC